MPSQIFADSSNNTFSVLKNSINSEPFGFVFFDVYICLKKRSSSSRISFGSVNFVGSLTFKDVMCFFLWFVFSKL